MHNLHFILVRADSADEAAEIAFNHALGFGDEDNNWFKVGGIASEDGWDDRNHHGNDTHYPLSYLDDVPAAPQAGTCFARAVGLLRNDLANPPDIQAAVDKLADEMRRVRLPDGLFEFWRIIENLKRLYSILYSSSILSDGDIPEFRRYEFDHFGLTAIDQANEPPQGQKKEQTRRYIVFLDMHS
jgi:hypothetical protein